MIDLHSHILPDLDDGAESFQESIEMARMAVDSGVNVMVATPHCSSYRGNEVRDKVLIFRDMLEDLDIPLKVCMGMEIFATDETLSLLKEKKLYTLNNSRYPLVEFSFDSDGIDETYLLKELVFGGYTPLVAHPERYGFVMEDPQIINKWAKMGCLFQINKGSLLGRFGIAIQRMAVSLLNRGFASVIASDAHSAKYRTPWMKDAEELIIKGFGSEAADLLLYQNPKKILRNEKITGNTPVWY